MRTGDRGKGREQARRHYHCRQVHIGYTSVSQRIQTLSVVELREPRNLCVCVSEDRGHGEIVGVHATLQIHEGDSSVSTKIQAECLGLSCENQGTRVC